MELNRARYLLASALAPWRNRAGCGCAKMRKQKTGQRTGCGSVSCGRALSPCVRVHTVHGSRLPQLRGHHADVATAVAEKFDKYDCDRPFSAWVVGIARNKVLMHLRTNSSDRHVFDADTPRSWRQPVLRQSRNYPNGGRR